MLVSGWFWLLCLGIFSVGYGFKGERVPGKIITILDNDSDNSLRHISRYAARSAMNVTACVNNNHKLL